MRRLVLAAVLLLALPSGAIASSTTIGQTSPYAVACNLDHVLFQAATADAPGYAAPAGGGVITSWSTHGGAATGSLKLTVVRPQSGGQYLVVGQSEERAIVPTVANTFAVSPGIVVAPGDLLGVADTGGNPACAFKAASGDVLGGSDTGIHPPPGYTFKDNGALPGHRLNLTAVVESDADGDGLGDDTQDADDDNDGVPDAAEAAAGTNPAVADSDGDGARDVMDVCPRIADPSQADRDGDGTGDACDPDRDNDGLDDADEVARHTSPLDRDSDDDGLADGQEVGLRLDPARRDSDGDRLTDGLERGLRAGVADPPGPVEGTALAGFRSDRGPSTTTNARKVDTDGDGLRDGREDRNHNGRRDRRETDPRRFDTDRDGVTDRRDRHPLNRRRR